MKTLLMFAILLKLSLAISVDLSKLKPGDNDGCNNTDMWVANLQFFKIN